MNSGTNVVFFGTEDFSLAGLRALVENAYNVALVVTKPDSPRGRGLSVSEPAVKTYAREHGITVVQPEKMPDAIAAISTVTNRIGILSAYGKIVPQAVLDLFGRGITNIHPSLLPRYRGPSPIETAVMNGDRETGVSLMRLVRAMDAGPVYAQETVTVDSDITAPELYETLGRVGAALLIEYLPSIIDGSLAPAPQDDKQATYTELLKRSDALVNKSVQSAAVIERHVRAYGVYPRTKMMFGDHAVIISAAHVAHDDAPGLVVDCADSSRLSIDEVIAPSGRRMSGGAFKNGYLA